MGNDTAAEKGSIIGKTEDEAHKLQDRLRKANSLEEMFKQTGFSVINFSDLDSELQDGIKKSKSDKWHGYPLGKKDIQLPNSKIFVNKNKDTIYCVIQIGGVYQWSRIVETPDSYTIIPIDDNSDLGLLIDPLLVFEIYQKYDPETYSEKPSDTRIIPRIRKTVIEETRDKTKDVMGLA